MTWAVPYDKMTATGKIGMEEDTSIVACGGCDANRTVDHLEAESYKSLFWQFFLATNGLLFLVVALLAKAHGMPVLKLCAKIPACGFLFASLFCCFKHFIWTIRRRNLYETIAFVDDDGDGELKPLPKVVGWCKWSDKYRDWHDVHHCDDGARLAIMNEIRRNKYKFGGTYHQQGEFGCPVMEDGTVYIVTMRSWGSIMADVWGGDYCEYAWSDAMGEVPRKSATPVEKTEEDIKAEQEAKKESEAKWRKSQEERERKMEEKNERNRKAVTTFVNSLSRRFTGHSTALVKYLRTELPGMLERSRDSSHGDDWKWVLNEKERARIEKENEKKRKEWLENFKKNGMDFLVNGSDAVENEKCEELPNGDC